MAVKIRLKRLGRRNRPFYRVCVFDARTRRDGAPIEELGAYDPMAESFGEKVKVKEDRLSYWLSVGAQPSETVASFMRKLGIDRRGNRTRPAADPVATSVPEGDEAAPEVTDAVAATPAADDAAPAADGTGAPDEQVG
jgi:small subunit ribosomal protein S16